MAMAAAVTAATVTAVMTSAKVVAMRLQSLATNLVNVLPSSSTASTVTMVQVVPSTLISTPAPLADPLTAVRASRASTQDTARLVSMALVAAMVTTVAMVAMAVVVPVVMPSAKALVAMVAHDTPLIMAANATSTTVMSVRSAAMVVLPATAEAPTKM